MENKSFKKLLREGKKILSVGKKRKVKIGSAEKPLFNNPKSKKGGAKTLKDRLKPINGSGKGYEFKVLTHLGK